MQRLRALHGSAGALSPSLSPTALSLGPSANTESGLLGTKCLVRTQPLASSSTAPLFCESWANEACGISLPKEPQLL